MKNLYLYIQEFMVAKFGEENIQNLLLSTFFYFYPAEHYVPLLST